MRMPYTHRHSGIYGVPREVSEPSLPDPWPYLYSRNATQIDSLSSVHQPNKQQSPFGCKKSRDADSPISPFSLPQSSAGSDPLPLSNFNYHDDLDSHRSTHSNQSWNSQHTEYHKSSLDGAYYRVGTQIDISPLKSTGNPDSFHEARIIESSGPHHSSVDSSGMSLKHRLQELESTLFGPDADDTEFTHLIYGGNASLAGPWTGVLQDLLRRNSEHTFVERERASFPHSGSVQYTQVAVPSVNNLVISNARLERTMAPDEAPQSSFLQPSAESLSQSNSGSRAKDLLVSCAAAIAEDQRELAESIMGELKQAVSVYGDPIQRLAAYMAEGLVARLESSGSSIYERLKCREAPAAELLSAMQKLYEICPYFKFGYLAANGAIAEAFKDEAKVHILDFQIAQGTQWISLIQALANRSGGAPSIRITTVDDPESQASPVGGMKMVKQRLGELADTLGVPFEFNSVPVKMSEVQAHMIERRPGEALAVNFAMQLHHMPDESVCITNPRDRLLRMVKSMNPKVLTLVEQEANTNTSPFFQRFIETLAYYTAVFESIDVTLPRESKDRVNVEEQCLARDIVNVIACEGSQRVERHELTGKWRARMMMAGFRSHPLNSLVNNTIRCLLESYSENYRLEEEGGSLFLGWLSRPLVVASAWK